MAGITVVVVLSTVYKDVIVSTPLSFLFWYFAGIVAAARMSPFTASAPALGANNGTRWR
jgi:hypothetical protein